MPRTCTICSHPLRAEIDRVLSEGGLIAQTASDYAVSPDALKRHRANHLLPAMAKELSSDPELAHVDPLAEIRSLYHRISDHLARAEAEPDNWQAIRAFHSEARRDLELLAKLMGDLDERPQVNILISPQWRELRTLIVTALGPYREAREAVLTALAGAGDGRA
jgi:hypothetical protein